MPAARSVLDKEIAKLNDYILQLASLVDEAVHKAIMSLKQRDTQMAQSVIDGDEEINRIRYQAEEEMLRILATQFPTATDLRRVVAAAHVAVELERMGDHASGIANLVWRLEEFEDLTSLHQLPKMAKRARAMVQDSVDTFMRGDIEKAWALIKRDIKLNDQYASLFDETIQEMHDEYVHQATYLLWVGHNLERVGDRATNIAERAIFAYTGDMPNV
ncbi:MAG TPA: phosphate signaling complex protein PhoU [Anaerolineae bacterium]|nr:phosphate signaling complex protein PhoU [Anaerolineae bacterium]